MNFKVDTFDVIPSQNRAKVGELSPLVEAAKNLVNGQKLVIDLGDTADFKKDVEKLCASFRKPGVLNYRPITRSNKVEKTLTVYNNGTK